MVRKFTCYDCGKSAGKTRRPIPEQRKAQAEEKLGRPLQHGDIICNACRRRLYRSEPLSLCSLTSRSLCSNASMSTSGTSVEKSPRSVRLNINSTPRSHRNCVLCRRTSGPHVQQVVVPSLAIVHALINTSILIHADSRCCKCHLDNGFFTAPSLDMLKSTKESEHLSRTEISDLLQDIMRFLKSSSHVTFDNPSEYSDGDYKNLTGLSKDQFSCLTTFLHSLNNTAARSVRTCLGVFLSKLRTGLSNSLLATLFGLTESQVQRIIPAVRECLMKYFVPLNLGFQHITRSDFIKNHTTPIARKLFSTETPDSDQAILVMDGTYIYIEKSSDYSFQRKSYSLHKNRPLVKPMMIVGTDGYILSVVGPYFADYGNNDASITKHMFANNVEDVKGWLNGSDVLIVDRGFRDAVSFLEDSGYRVEMPYFLKKGCKQHSTEEANSSRLVTKVRWVVESANGRIKQWKFLNNVVHNTLVPHIGDFVKIVCALCNRFRPPLADMDPDTEVIAEKMLSKLGDTNSVQLFVEENNLRKKKSVYKSIEASNDDLTDFPDLSLDYLREITLGIYQIKQSIHYSLEHLREDGSYDLLICKDLPFLLHVKIQSRHSKNTIHLLWIRYCTETRDPITGWYCTCKVGARQVGCCAHIASVLWYLGYQRRQDQPLVKKTDLTKCLQNAADPVRMEE